jgi:hypothetical protein
MNENSTALQYVREKPLLQRRGIALDDPLHLAGKLALHRLFQTAEQERPKDLVKTSNNEKLLLFVQLHAFARVRKRLVEPFLERLGGLENLGKNKVEKRPQLGKIVLQSKNKKKKKEKGNSVVRSEVPCSE